jgi:predicted ATPase
MLTGVTIKNFRCLRDVTIQLEPLTIVVGPNASGKSSLLKALNPQQQMRGPQDFWHGQPGMCERIFRFADRAPIECRDVQVVGGEIRRSQQGDAFAYQFLQLDPGGLRKANVLTDERRLTADGSNLANVVATLSRRQQDQLASEFSRLVPVYRDVNPRPAGGGHHRLLFQDRWQQDAWYEPSHVSDGSLIVLALLTLGYQESPPDLIVIEELERGLHPYLIGEILSVLRKMTRGEVGKKQTQVVIATHSAELLEFAEAKEVRFLTRTDDGGVTVEEAPTAAPDWEQVVKDHQGSLGNLWLSGGLGGVPGGLGT